MRFCEKCGSRLRETKDDLRCPKCNKLIRSKQKVKPTNIVRQDTDAVFVVERSENDYVKALRKCPECGNNEAFHWYSRISGEHAGVRRERTVEHFKCTKCSHSWSISS